MGQIGLRCIRGITTFCFWEEYMYIQTCNSVIQNHCRMLGRYVAGGSSNTVSLGESNPLHSIRQFISPWHSSRSKKKEVCWLVQSAKLREFLNLQMFCHSRICKFHEVKLPLFEFIYIFINLQWLYVTCNSSAIDFFFIREVKIQQ